MFERQIYGVTPYNRPRGKKGKLRKNDFTYDETQNCYWCPANEKLSYRTTDRDGYRHYRSEKKKCCHCQLLGQCTASKQKQKVITRHIWQNYKDQMDSHRKQPIGKLIYSRRKETVERSFADAKELHSHRYAKMRGIKKVQEQCFLSAACQNMKKIALHLYKLFFTPNFQLFLGIFNKSNLIFLYNHQISKIIKINPVFEYQIQGFSTA